MGVSPKSVRLPKDWSISSLREVGNWYSGGTPRMTDRRLWKGDIPWVSPKEMKALRIHDTSLHVSEMAIGNGTRLIPQGTILIVVRGMILAHSLPVARAERQLAFNQDIKAVVVRTGVISEYVLRWFEANETRVLSITAESTHGTKRLPSEDLYSIEIPVPQPDEQQAIAVAFNDVDALILALDRLIGKKRELKQAAMQQLLTGKRRLRGYAKPNQGSQQSEVGRIPADWEVRTLGQEIAGLDAGVSVNSIEGEPAHDSERAKVLKTSAVLDGRFVRTECKIVAPEDLHRVRTNPHADNIIISRMNTPDLVGECGYVETDHPTLFLPDRLWITRFRASTDVCARWLSLLLSSPSYKWRIKATATGTSGSMKNISKDALFALPIPFPHPDEQRAIAAVLSDMDAEIATLELRRDKTRLLKQGMMQELLTGRIRLV